MPDRYGESDPPEHSRVDRQADIAIRLAAAACELCDDDGYRGSTVCDHEDRKAIYKRGMQLVRETLGWNR